MFVSAITGQFAEELAELHDGSISLFVTLPVFRTMVLSECTAAALSRFEAAIGEHLAYLDGILGDVLVRRDRADGDLTKSLFRSVLTLRVYPPSAERDDAILAVLEQAQLFLMGSCGYALRFARQAGVDRSVWVLEASMSRIGSLASHVPSAREELRHRFASADAVA
jgi:hypothetical protein